MSDDNVSKQGTTCSIELWLLIGMSKVLCENDYEGPMVNETCEIEKTPIIRTTKDRKINRTVHRGNTEARWQSGQSKSDCSDQHEKVARRHEKNTATT